MMRRIERRGRSRLAATKSPAMCAAKDRGAPGWPRRGAWRGSGPALGYAEEPAAMVLAESRTHRPSGRWWVRAAA